MIGWRFYFSARTSIFLPFHWTIPCLTLRNELSAIRRVKPTPIGCRMTLTVSECLYLTDKINRRRILMLTAIKASWGSKGSIR